MDTLIHVLIGSILFVGGHTQDTPVWDYDQVNAVYKREDAPLGELLITMRVNGTGVTIEKGNEDARQLCNITETRIGANTIIANITLASELDTDYNPQRRYPMFIATSTTLNTAQAQFNLIILDINDTPPEFLNQPYRGTPFESTHVGEAVVGGISVTDRDVTTQTITVDMVPDALIDSMFELNQTGNNVEILLKSTLDYETRNIYTITLVATDDGGLNSTTTAEVNVQDVQDTPPFFLFDVYRGAVVENNHNNTSIIQVQAEDGDGDRDNQNPIRYSIVTGRVDLFHIDTLSGVIYATHSLDRESPDVVAVNGVFTLVVQAEELNMTFPQYGNMTARVNVYVTVEDVNDNPPTFNTTVPYTAFIRDDVPDDSLIYFGGEGYMQVYDRDQTGQSATFALSIEGENSKIFSPSPAEGFSEANVLIRVQNASFLRGLGATQITFYVIAEEVHTSDRFSSRAAVVLSVEETDPPTTTPAPLEEELFKAPDIVVFVVGFLVLLNIVTSVAICYLLRGRGRREKEGLTRTGSKYYIKKRSTNDFTNHGMHNPSTTEMIEVDPELAVCPRDPGHALAANTRGTWRDRLTSPRF